ncbi:hypothetical protein IQ235_04065 [Oscillatoriales cyanobacterium LEGE 11467]|uniref:Uncharacterized protein n=1 Tax=Zarconia navalis LEGE 11467 TaxID=1828826 RepID=A0A928Z642_9CYAN|nr:hypothetical protein [Zarconia navalis]MBE9039967.1 hypothetical protein [Zarconia navalis LEGE 11467]
MKMEIDGTQHKIRVFLNDGTQIIGAVFIKGYRARLSDLINNSQPFLNIVNAQLSSQDGIVSHPFLCLNKPTIHSVIEESTPRKNNQIMASCPEIELN